MIEHLQSLVQVHGVVVSATILLVAYVFIALEKIPKVTIALLGAAITIILGLSFFLERMERAVLVEPIAVNPLWRMALSAQQTEEQ